LIAPANRRQAVPWLLVLVLVLVLVLRKVNQAANLTWWIKTFQRVDGK
jgi:hypothetical protein